MGFSKRDLLETKVKGGLAERGGHEYKLFPQYG